MSNPQIVVEMDADEAKMWQKFKRIENAEGSVEAALKAIGRAAKQAASDQTDLQRAAVRTLKAIETPQERHNRKIEELNRLYGANKLSVDQFRRALTQVRDEYAKVTDVAQENTGALDEAANAGNRAFGSAMFSQVKGLLGALGLGGGLAGVLAMVNKEYAALIERQAESARQSMTVADAQIKFLRNLQPESEAERNQAIADIEALAMETGVSVKDLYLRGGSAMSARGALSKEAAMKAVAASARLVPEDMGEGEEVAGAALDLMKVTGSDDAKGAAGFLMEVAKRARLTKTGAVARNLVQPLIASMLRGDTEQEAAALFAAITTGAGDPRGEMSGTSMATLAQQLAEELPDLASTRARIEAVQKSPELQAKILPDLKGEAKTKGVMEQLLTGEGGVSQAYQEYLATMPGVEESAESYRKLVGMIEGTEIQRTARFGRMLDATMEQLATADQRGARIGLIREKFAPLLRQTGMGALATDLEGLSVRASGDDLADFLRSLEEQERTLRGQGGGETWLRNEARKRGGGVAADEFVSQVAERQATRNRQADVVRSVIDSFGDLALPAGPQKTAAAEPGARDLYEQERRPTAPSVPARETVPAAEPGARDLYEQERRPTAPSVPARETLPAAEPGPRDLYEQERRPTAPSVPARETLPAAEPGARDLYEHERRGQTRTPATPQTAGQIGGPKPGDLITPVVPVPVPVSDLYQQERGRTEPPEATAAQAYRMPSQRELLGAKYATADLGTLPGGNPAIERQTDAIHEGNKLLKEIRDELSGHTKGLLPIDVFRHQLPASSSADNNVHRE